jgi:hypothetical protein
VYSKVIGVATSALVQNGDWSAWALTANFLECTPGILECTLTHTFLVCRGFFLEFKKGGLKKKYIFIHQVAENIM